MKESLNALTYTGCCRIVNSFHMPLWRQFLVWIVYEVLTFYLWSFSPPHNRVGCRWSSLRSSFGLFIYGRVILATEGKSVMPMDESFLGIHTIYGTIRTLSYLYFNPLRFLIFFLVLLFSFLGLLRQSCGYNDANNNNRIEACNKLTDIFCSSITFQPPILLPTWPLVTNNWNRSGMQRQSTNKLSRMDPLIRYNNSMQSLLGYNEVQGEWSNWNSNTTPHCCGLRDVPDTGPGHNRVRSKIEDSCKDA